MHLVSAPAIVSTLRRLVLETRETIEFLDVTDEVTSIVRTSGVRDGIVTVFSKHTTAAVRVQEDEPLLLDDLRLFLERCAPAGDHYGHNDFRIRTVHMHDDESPNGHSHCLQMMLGTSETIPVMDGELQLGQWQRIFVIELDGPRAARDVIVQVLGSIS